MAMHGGSSRFTWRVLLVGVVSLALTSLSGPAWAARSPNTRITAKPASITSSTTASFSFTSTMSGSTFTCTLDAGDPVGCSSPTRYTNLPDGAHTFSVYATARGASDASAATYSWTIDTLAPTVPANLTASTPTSTSVALAWTASTDPGGSGVSGYTVLRNGSPLASIGAVTSYTDTTVAAGSTNTYAVAALDRAGNSSGPSSPVIATTPDSAPAPTAGYASALTRAPYLTDLVGLGVIVNFATDRSSSVASVAFGSASSGTCTLSTTVSASRITVAVGSVYEYQWKAKLTLPTTGTYCYRPYLGSLDLLGTNPSPQFDTQVPVGSTQPYSFAVLGDWGQAYASPGNLNQTNLLAQIAKSGALFAVTTGDNGYPSGSQLNYGDLQQSGADISAIFGVGQWGVPGASIPLFPAIGNHGLARNDAIHPQFANWPQDSAVATSNGSYSRTYYPSVNGSAAANYPSPWYAFDVGTSRFYVLDAAWADNNVGTGTVYSDEYLSHWTPGSAQYQWLLNDLQAHPSGLKFAFFHYPLYSDQPSESSDTFLQGASSLEGLLVSHGVAMIFNGHAHIYQRSVGLDGLVSYVTGGGGGKAQSTGRCSGNDMYAIGWSYTKGRGTACGAAQPPSSDAQVYHFLKVSVAGTQVTVTPTDSTGATFDVATYNFTAAPDTFIDSAPPPATPSSSASFSFHASVTPATFTCALDGAAPTNCTSPVDYAGLAEGSHTFSVQATVAGVSDPQPAVLTWTVDSTAPSTPTGFTATATSPFSVELTWSASTDNTGVTGYDVYRDGALYQSLPATTTGYTDTAVLAASTYGYAVRARDIAGNASALTPTVSVTTPAPAPLVFSDGFESGDLSAWRTTSGLVVQTGAVHTGSYAARGSTTNGATYAKVSMPGSYADAFSRIWFEVISQTDQINLLRYRDGAGASLGYVYLASSGRLGFHNDATGKNTLSSVSPGPGWHALELEMSPSATPGGLGTLRIWLDNTVVTDLSATSVDVGSTPVGGMQIGETQTGRSYDIVFDDVAFGTSRIGP